MEYTAFGRTGMKVSKIGLGGAPLGGVFGATDDTQVRGVIHAAIDYGINFIDTAPAYGNGLSEERIGRSLAEDGKRQRMIVATKAVQFGQSYDYGNTLRSIDDSLRRLRTDYVDLLQIHDAERQSFDVVMNETLPALQRAKRDGKARFIGVTGRNLEWMKAFLASDQFDSMQIYVRYMLLDHTAKDEVLPLAREKGVGIINSSVLGMGILSGSPADFLKPETVAEAESRMQQLAFVRQEGSRGFIEPAMRFSLGNDNVHVTLTGTSSIDSLAGNIAYCDGRGLAADQVDRIHRLFQGQPLFG